MHGSRVASLSPAVLIPRRIAFGGLEPRREPAMQLKEQYLQQAVVEVEDLAERVAVLKARIAKQKINIKVQHQWELEYVRNCFAEFKGRIEELENANEANLEEAHGACELAWRDLQYGVDTLLSALP